MPSRIAPLVALFVFLPVWGHTETATGAGSLDSSDELALAEKQVAIKCAAVKVAEARKLIAVAKLSGLKGRVAEARAEAAFAAKQLKRFEELEKARGVDSGQVDERRAKWEAASARVRIAEAGLAEGDGCVRLEEALILLAREEAGEAELRLKLLKARLGR
jgi:multidrug resistance efflux pump